MERVAAIASNHIHNHNQVLDSSNDSQNNHIVTRIDRKLYEAALEGNMEPFINLENLKSVLTPTKNTVLHLHLTSSSSNEKLSPTSSLVHFLRTYWNLMYQIVPKNGRFYKQETERVWLYKQIPEFIVSREFVEQILDECGDLVLLSNSKKETPLHVAARYGHSEIAKILIERARALPPQDIEHNGSVGAEKGLIRAKNSEGDTALHEAVRYNHIQVVKILLQMDPHYPNSPNHAKETPLYLAAERKYEDIMREILKKVTSPAFVYDGPNGRTALHAAVINCDQAMTHELLANEHVRGAVKHADKKGWVPLHYAVKIGNHHLTKLLLEQDQNTAYMQDEEGKTALHVAAYGHRWDIVKMIIEYYPDCTEIVDNKGWNALHCAVKGNRPLTVNRIIAGNLTLSNLYNEKDVDGNTPLHHLPNSEIIAYKYMFHHRVDKLAVNKKGQTPLDVACCAGDDLPFQFRMQIVMRDLKRAGSKRSQRNQEEKDYGKDNKSKLAFTKEAKEAHLLVATLIATVTFAAGIALPGGTIQDGDGKGSPILGHKASFKAFLMSNTISLVLSASAAFIHLFSPLKNKDKWNDSYLSEVAFSFTLVAIAAMVVAFATATYTVLGSSSTGIAVITIGFAFFLVFKQVLELNFCVPFIIPFIKNVVNIIIFPRPLDSFWHPESY